MIFIISIILCLTKSNRADVSLTTLDSITYPFARCMDGSSPGYYLDPATDVENQNKWIFYLEGGGECDTETTCKSHLTDSLGSSLYFSLTSEATEWYFASSNCTTNFPFCSWNRVKVPYCTQDLHSGQIKYATDKTWGLYFAGHLNLEAILDDLVLNNNLNSCEEVIISGVSAGGIGVWLNVDYVQSRFTTAAVSAATLAGHYFYATFYEGTNHTSPSGMADFRETGIDFVYSLYDAFVDESCKSAMDSLQRNPSTCMLSNYSLTYIDVPSFIAQAQTDQVVLEGHDNLPPDYIFESEEQQFIKSFYENMTIALKPFYESSATSTKKLRKGAFAVACYTHVGFDAASPTINSLNYLQTFSNYYNVSNSNSSTYQLADTCGIMCNPTCKIM